MVRSFSTKAKDGTRPVQVFVADCHCKHVFQDERYGKGKRLVNECKPTEDCKGTAKAYRCTVCSTEHKN